MLSNSALCVGWTIIALTWCLPHGERKCFTTFEDFDECWEDIEEFCLDDHGEFERCHQETGKEEIVSFQLSKHCYAS